MGVGNKHASFNVLEKTHVRHRLVIMSKILTEKIGPAYLSELPIAESRVIEAEDRGQIAHSGDGVHCSVVQDDDSALRLCQESHCSGVNVNVRCTSHVS